MDGRQMKTCPRCSEDILAEAVRCKFCHAEISALSADEVAQAHRRPLGAVAADRLAVAEERAMEITGGARAIRNTSIALVIVAAINVLILIGMEAATPPFLVVMVGLLAMAGIGGLISRHMIMLVVSGMMLILIGILHMVSSSPIGVVHFLWGAMTIRKYFMVRRAAQILQEGN